MLSLNLLAGDYVAFVSHCCTAFGGSTNADSGIHAVSADPFLTWVVTFSQDVTVGAAAEVPEPGSLALLGLGLVGLAASRKRKQA